MRRFIFAALAIMLSAGASTLANDSISSSLSFPPETLHYNVMFKWGLINKKAGTAVLSLSHAPGEYHTTLTAASEPWADRIYSVRDTLNGRMALDGFRPLFYEKIAHEGNEFKHDQVHYDYTTPGEVVGHCSRRVFNKNKLKINETRQMSAEGSAVDMLTSFYYMRQLPFDDMQPGHKVSIDIFSGKQKETLTIRYVGMEPVAIDGNRQEAYHVKFLFTSKGGTKTSDDMDAWISTGPRRIPLKLEGKLPVGKVRCFFAGEDTTSRAATGATPSRHVRGGAR